MISRRRFLYTGSALVALVGAFGWFGKSRRLGTPDPADARGAIPPTVAFLGALFGHPLSDADRAELTERLSFVVQASAELGEDYTVLAAQLDRFAQEAGSAGFLAASASQRDAVVGQIMRIEAPSLLERLWTHLVRTRMQYYRMRFETVPQLAWLYRHSGVPWRARGYARWQGVPGDWHEYTRAGAPYP